MKLAEALTIAAQNPPAGAAPPFLVALACGFTPLHLQTFLVASLRQRCPDRHISVTTGLFDDVPGTLRDLRGKAFDAVIVAIEWADLDARLGLRRLGGWSPAALPEIVEGAAAWLDRVRALVSALAETSPVVVSLPTLPLPPIFTNANWQSGGHELRLREAVARFAADVAAGSRVRIVSEAALAAASPAAARMSVKSTWTSGFPYSIAHASALAQLLAAAAENRLPKKGVITDLDNTLWSGVVGDDGVDGVCWDLDRHAHGHGIFQQLLASLSEEGVLVAVASKNDPAIVEEAFRRDDLLLPKERVFPFEVGWGSKAEAVSRVLAAWNIGAGSAVFVDDSAAELAEVKAAHPDIECIQFPSDPDALYAMLGRLRDLVGKPFVSEEDAIRLESLRARSALRSAAPDDPDGFSESLLETANAELTLDFRKDPLDARALALINKTNQFNLNGRRLSEGAWAGRLQAPGTFVLTATYRDRFGLLGKIAVMTGRVEHRLVYLDCWVMSCRAFARRIEHQCLKALFERFDADAIVFDYAATPRNAPLTRALAALLGAEPAPGARLTRAAFGEACPRLFHRVVVTGDVGDERYAHAAR
jgi:FkbH-like protein